MSETRAWLNQAQADYRCAETLLLNGGTGDFCHVIAKYQQAVEKSVKATWRAFSGSVNSSHRVAGLAQTLLRLPQRRQKDVVGHIRGLFNSTAINDIQALDDLVPQWPTRHTTEAQY